MGQERPLYSAPVIHIHTAPSLTLATELYTEYSSCTKIKSTVWLSHRPRALTSSSYSTTVRWQSRGQAVSIPYRMLRQCQYKA